MRREIAGAEQAVFLAGVGDEHHRPARRLAGLDELAGRLDHRRNARGIVERAIVDIASSPGLRILVEAEMVEVGHQHDMFASPRGIAPGSTASDFGALEVLPIALRRNRHGGGKRQSRERACQRRRPRGLPTTCVALARTGARARSIRARRWPWSPTPWPIWPCASTQSTTGRLVKRRIEPAALVASSIWMMPTAPWAPRHARLRGLQMRRDFRWNARNGVAARRRRSSRGRPGQHNRRSRARASRTPWPTNTSWALNARSRSVTLGRTATSVPAASFDVFPLIVSEIAGGAASVARRNGTSRK